MEASEAIALKHPRYESEEIPPSVFNANPAWPDDKVETVSVSHLIVARKALSETTVAAFLHRSADIAACLKRVESRCGAVVLGRTYLLPPLSSTGASMVPPWLRFHIPLIEPDRQISRIRLSDKTSRFRVQRHRQLLNIYRS